MPINGKSLIYKECRPLCGLPQIPATNIRLPSAFSSIRTMWRSQYNLLTYLIGHNNPFNGLPQHKLPGASASCAPTSVGHINRWQAFLDLVLPTDIKSSSTPTSADPRLKYSSAGAFSSIRTTWPSQRSRWILIRCTIYKSLRSSYTSLLYRMRKSSPTRTEPKD